ncbi:MAG: alpha/beta hydrolase [Beijerinckiaceae bacterium]|nr:alpha/beta hydrolase [Beijerinckiaceae bacterium]
MRTSEADILFVPGEPGGDPDHWMNRWESRLKTARTIAPDRDDVASLAKLILAEVEGVRAGRPLVLVGHGAGVHAIVQAAASGKFGTGEAALVRGAFLVNPSSAWNLPAPPRDPLPFPSLLVASHDDPHASFEEMHDLGLDWGAHVVDAGPIGRIDATSGHGPWPEGLMRFGAFIARL